MKNTEFIEAVFKSDIVLLCETWTHKYSDAEVKGYVRFSKTRKPKKRAKRASGGLEVYIKENLIKGIKVLEWDFEDGLHFKFDNDFFGFEKPLYLFFTYFKPKNSSRADIDNYDNCFDILLDKIANVPEDGAILVTGDLNSRVSDIQECNVDFVYTNDFIELSPLPLCDHVFNSSDFNDSNMSVKRVNKDVVINDYGYKLIDLCNTCDLAILNGRAGSDKFIGQTTFCGPKGESTVDYAICDKYVLKNITEFDISDHVAFSDHKMLSFKMKTFINLNDNPENVSTNVEDEIFYYTKWNEEKKGSYIKNLEHNDVILQIDELSKKLVNIDNKQTLDDIICTFSDIVTTAGSDHVHKINVNGKIVKGKFWFDEDCQLERVKFLKFKQIFSLNDTDENRKNMCRQRGIYRRLCRRKRKLYNQSKAEDLLILSKKNPKLFWKKFKNDKKQHNRINSNLNFFDHFKNLAAKNISLSEQGKNEVKILFTENVKYIEVLDCEVTFDELSNEIKNLKRSKSSGHDAVINEFLIHAPDYIKCFLVLIFNAIISLEYIPENWCIGTIVPVFKSGDQGEVNNYRGITLISVLCKLFTKIMNSRLNKWAESENILTESQFGFRAHRGTTDCLFILHGLIEQMLSKGKKLFAAFIDYEKAFDYLDRGAIWAKLIKSGVSSKCIRIFRSLYEKMKLEVKQGKKGNSFSSSTGILQGECTSPIFFSFFVNDLENSISTDNDGIEVYDIFIRLLMYADDMVIFSDSESGLQEALNNLKFYCNKWGISVNTKKTKVVVFKKGSFSANSGQWVYGDHILEVVPYFKYLGLSISANGSFAYHFKETVNSARRALFGLRKSFNDNPEIYPKMKIDLFNSMVTPILFYGCEVWGFCKADSLERFYISFLKNVLGVKQSTPNCFVYGELGLYPLIIERKVRILKYWFKILKSEENSFLRKVYNDLLLLSEISPEKVTWVTLFKQMLFENGFGFIWLEQNVDDENIFLRIFEQRIKDSYYQEWCSNINSTSDFRLYKKIKQSFSFENYLHMENSLLRTAITKIRLSSHLFYIERGRWSKPKIEAVNRICDTCFVLEDEYHCIIECPKFTNERKSCLPSNLLKKPSMFDFVRFFKCTDKNMFHKIGLLCYKIMKAYKTQYLQE